MFFYLTLLLVGLDCYLSFRRIKAYGPNVELNPVARLFAQDFGPWAAVGFIVWWNLGLLLTLAYYGLDTGIHILFGAKLGLAAMQLKSLQLETIIERILRKPNVK